MKLETWSSMIVARLATCPNLGSSITFCQVTMPREVESTSLVAWVVHRFASQICLFLIYAGISHLCVPLTVCLANSVSKDKWVSFGQSSWKLICAGALARACLLPHTCCGARRHRPPLAESQVVIISTIYLFFERIKSK